MSVSLIVANPTTPEQQLINIPVATEEVFNNIWLTASDELGLQLVPVFSSGIDIGVEELDDLLIELGRLKRWAESREPQTAEMIQMQERISRLIEEMPPIVTSASEVFIG